MYLRNLRILVYIKFDSKSFNLYLSLKRYIWSFLWSQNRLEYLYIDFILSSYPCKHQAKITISIALAFLIDKSNQFLNCYERTRCQIFEKSLLLKLYDIPVMQNSFMPVSLTHYIVINEFIKFVISFKVWVKRVTFFDTNRKFLLKLLHIHLSPFLT